MRWSPAAHVLGRAAAGDAVTLALTLPLRDQAGLDNLLHRLYDPNDPAYGQFLTPDEFAARFSPTPEDYATVAAFARQQGLIVTATHPNRLVLDVSGPASRVETAFGVHLLRYRSDEGRVFRAPDADPAVPAALAGRIAEVVGLDTAAHRRPHLRPALTPPLPAGRRADCLRPTFRKLTPSRASPPPAPGKAWRSLNWTALPPATSPPISRTFTCLRWPRKQFW